MRFVTAGSEGSGKSSLAGRVPNAAHGGDLGSILGRDFSADAALIVVDARAGIVGQTRHHSYLVSLLRIRHVALAINKMDLVHYQEARCREIEAEYRRYAERIGMRDVACIPISVLEDENVRSPSARMPWYRGAPLVRWLENLDPDDAALKTPLRFAVQGEGLSGTVVSGRVRVGQRVRVQPSGKDTRVARIVRAGVDLDEAGAGQSVALALGDEIDVARGELICAADAPAQVADQFEATIVWMSAQPLLRGRSYLMKTAAKKVNATVSPLKYRINPESLERLAADKLDRDEVGVGELELDQPMPFDPYVENRGTGAFTLIDPLSDQTVGAGMLHFALRRAHNIHLQHVDVDKASRAELKRQKPCVLWLTGLSGAGKSTLANLVEKRLHALGHHTYLLDGDNIRHGLNKDLGFTAEDRVENIRRIAEVAKLMVDAGLIVLTAFISPFRAERRMARALFAQGEFFEVFVDAPLAVAERRDPKGLYKKARRGEIKNFTGIDSPYEPPQAAELRVDTNAVSPADASEMVLGFLSRMRITQTP